MRTERVTSGNVVQTDHRALGHGPAGRRSGVAVEECRTMGHVRLHSSGVVRARGARGSSKGLQRHLSRGPSGPRRSTPALSSPNFACRVNKAYSVELVVRAFSLQAHAPVRWAWRRGLKKFRRPLAVRGCQRGPGMGRRGVQPLRPPEHAGSHCFTDRQRDSGVALTRELLGERRYNLCEIPSPAKVMRRRPRSRPPKTPSRRQPGMVFHRPLTLTLRTRPDSCSQQRQALRRQDVRLFADSVGVGIVQLSCGDVQSSPHAQVPQSLLVVPGRSSLHSRLQSPAPRRRRRGPT